MKLYLLRPINPQSGPWKPWYDRAFGFVVRAETEAAARKMVLPLTGDELRNKAAESPWEDPSLTTCVELTADGDEAVIIRDFASA